VLLTCRWSNDTGHRGTFHTFVMKLWNPWYLYHGAKLHHGRGTMVPVCTTVLSPASCTMVPIPATYTMVIWGGTFVPWYMVIVHCTMVTMVLVPWCTAPNYHGAGTMVTIVQCTITTYHGTNVPPQITMVQVPWYFLTRGISIRCFTGYAG
jgi:hypothetical protein